MIHPQEEFKVEWSPMTYILVDLLKRVIGLNERTMDMLEAIGAVPVLITPTPDGGEENDSSKKS